MDLEKLKTVHDTAPAEATATAEAFLEWGNTPSIEKPIPITMRQAMRWMALTDGFFQLEKGIASGSKDQHRICRAAIEMIRSPHIDTLDLSDPEIGGMFDALVSFGLFTAEQKLLLMGMATETLSPFEDAGLDHVGSHHIALMLEGRK